MARAAVKAKQAQRAKAQPAKAESRRGRGRRKHAGGGNPNQQLFFVRMRRSAKPAYLVLAVLFAATFAFLGVGSGSSGLEGLFNNLNIFGHSGKSVSSALKQTQKHPNDPKAWRALATAYEAKGNTAGAVGALQQYTTLQPKSATAFAELAGLQMTQAQTFVTEYQNAYQGAQLAAPSAGLLPSAASSLGKALGTNPIEQAAASQQNVGLGSLVQKVQLAYSDAVSAYAKVTTIQPNNGNAWFQLAQAAQTSGDRKTAVRAYKAYLKLNPSSSTAGEIRRLIKQLGG